ncbi:MAG: RluA family pseudouridine synthase [Solirubrobacterales bacterium]
MSNVPEATVVYSDSALLVADKPAGLLVHPAPGQRDPTLVDQLAGEIGGGQDASRPGIVHRLDRDTSGLLVVARDNETHRSLASQIKDREVERRYVAMVQGIVESRTGTIDAPLGRDHRARERVTVGGRGPRDAVTHFEVRELLAADSVLDVKLETGRTHQIRVHVQSIGHPICGDPTYGSAGRHGLERQFLHAARLAFVHPRSGDRMSFASELPADLVRALDLAREPGLRTIQDQ